MGTTIGLVSPGGMGAVVGGGLVAAGRTVLWASDDRGDATRRRAEDAGLTDVGDEAALFGVAGTVLSICPPHAAVDVADRAAAAGFAGTYVDANAVAPATADAIAARVEPTARYVDGGIVGPPPHTSGTTRLFLAGGDAADVAALFDGGRLEAIALDAPSPAASALKMAYAAWTKGSAALLLAARAFAAATGVEDDLLAEWDRSQPGLADRSEATAANAGPKAWRWIGEMEEIAASLRAVDLPGGFHDGAADVYRALVGRRDAPDTTAADIIAALVDRTP